MNIIIIIIIKTCIIYGYYAGCYGRIKISDKIGKLKYEYNNSRDYSYYLDRYHYKINNKRIQYKCDVEFKKNK